MKTFFKCCQCGMINEFDTEKIARFVVRLRESYDHDHEDSREAYIVECMYCRAENKVQV